MVETHDHFTKRLRKLGRKHAQMTHGYTTKISKDGLIIVKPKRAKRGTSGLQLILIAVMVLFVFKAFALASIGPAAYDERVSSLREGTVVERAGAVVMAIDPISKALAEFAGPILR